MSAVAGKIGAPVASASTARFQATARSAFAAEEAIPISDVMGPGDAGPEEESLRDDEWDEGGGHPLWQGPKQRKPIIVSRFASVLTSYEIDRFLFQFRMIANDMPVFVPMAPVARRYEVNYIVLRYGSSLHGRHYNHLH